MAEQRVYRYSGSVLDVELELELGRAVKIGVKVYNKAGLLLEGKEFELSEKVVAAWLREFAGRKIRGLFR